LQYNRPSGHAPQAIVGSKEGFWQSEIGLLASWELDF